MSRMRAIAAGAAVALLLAGCGSDAPNASGGGATNGGAATPTRTASPAPASASAATTPGAQVPESLTFTATTVDGATFDGASLAGKPVVIWFWASWCPRCRAAADDVARVHRDFGDRVHVVGVAGLDSGQDRMRAFTVDHGIDRFVNLADDEGQVWRRFGVTTQEYYVLLDERGTVVHQGPLTASGLRDRVTALAG